MAVDKKTSPKDAAVAVLKKFSELLTKAEQDGKKADLDKDEPSAPPTDGGGTTINDQIGNPFGKSDAAAKPAAPAEAKPEGQMKGHIKLAKFIGHIQGKRSATKGVHEQSTATQNPGVSEAGMDMRMAGPKGNVPGHGPKEQHKEKLGELQSMPKPKLPG